MTIQELKEQKKGWINPKTGIVRYYVNNGQYTKKGSVFFSEKQETAKYTWRVTGEGFFHADKCYNGALIDELRETFPEAEIK